MNAMDTDGGTGGGGGGLTVEWENSKTRTNLHRIEENTIIIYIRMPFRISI